jgi:hypothetical protein
MRLLRSRKSLLVHQRLFKQQFDKLALKLIFLSNVPRPAVKIRALNGIQACFKILKASISDRPDPCPFPNIDGLKQ